MADRQVLGLSPRTELRQLLIEYGSHRVFYRLGRDANLPAEIVDRLECDVHRAQADIERELDRLGVPR